ncbi:MAG: hypothetical protein Q8Q88_19740 [Phenylobacterium sp.]|nr:hypothetical protein [Phenylobacterium sp.]MDP3749275.1 hypothetical protein [Phenylobacterium sp.]
MTGTDGLDFDAAEIIEFGAASGETEGGDGDMAELHTRLPS